jgi:ribosomal protein L37E
MSSTVDILKCPQCGLDAYIETNYSTNEEFVQCHHCGYGRTMSIENMHELKDQIAWQPRYNIEEIFGHGSYKYILKDSIGFLCGSFTDPRGVQEFCDLIESLGDQVDHAEYSTFIDNQVSNKILVQGGPGRTWIN